MLYYFPSFLCSLRVEQLFIHQRCSMFVLSILLSSAMPLVFFLITNVVLQYPVSAWPNDVRKHSKKWAVLLGWRLLAETLNRWGCHFYTDHTVLHGHMQALPRVNYQYISSNYIHIMQRGGLTCSSCSTLDCVELISIFIVNVLTFLHAWKQNNLSLSSRLLFTKSEPFHLSVDEWLRQRS